MRGTDGLRVGDASVMPEIPRANTNIPTIMVAEKLADAILDEWAGRIEKAEIGDGAFRLRPTAGTRAPSRPTFWNGTSRRQRQI